MSLQNLVRGEARAVRILVYLLSGPAGRTFFVRMGKRGQVMRFEEALTPELDPEPETMPDGKIAVYLTGVISEAQTASLAKGTADLTVYATNPRVRLVKGQVEVEDDIGSTSPGIL